MKKTHSMIKNKDGHDMLDQKSCNTQRRLEYKRRKKSIYVQNHALN